MTNEQKKQLLFDLIEIEEKGDIFNLTTADRAEFQMWVEGLIDNDCCEEREQGKCPFYAN